MSKGNSATTMRRVALRNIRSHKGRLVLTILSVVLGTAFISGSFMFTNSLQESFYKTVATAYEDVDVVVKGLNTEGDTTSAENSSSDIAAGITKQALSPEEVKTELEQRSGVSHINIQGNARAVAATGDNEQLNLSNTMATITPYYDSESRVGSPLEILEGEAPTSSREVLINESAARKAGINPGDTLVLVDEQKRREVTVSGIYTSVLDSMGSFELLVTEDNYLDNYLDHQPSPSYLVQLSEGDNPDSFVESLRRDYPSAVVETGKALAEEQSSAIKDALKFINYFFVAFGLMALLAGTFIIANTFSMIVAQRNKEFALLRALGVPSHIVLRSVIFEAFIIGIIGSAIGILCGMFLVLAIRAFINRNEEVLPAGGGIGLSLSAILVPLILGIIVVMISAWAPARRAAKTDPIEAMRAQENTTVKSLLVRNILGAVFLGVAFLCLLLGVFSSADTGMRMSAIAIAMVTSLLGVFLVSPALTIPVIGWLGRIIARPFGATGRIASSNARRQPRRTAATAFSLTLGVTLVAGIGMLGASMKSSIDNEFRSQISADYLVTPPVGGSMTMPAEAISKIQNLPGVTYSTTVGYATEISWKQEEEGTENSATGLQPITVLSGDADKNILPGSVEGTIDTTESGIFISRSFADQFHISLEDKLLLQNANDQVSDSLSVPVKAIYDNDQILGTLSLSEETFSTLNSGKDSSYIPQFIAVTGGSDGINRAELKQELLEATKEYIILQVQTPKEYTGSITQMVDTMLNLIYGLLGLAVIISVLGIINTLALNVIERRKEIGMLRATGMKRGAIRTMITIEAVQIALYGVVVGIVLGLILGFSFLKALSGEGMSEITFPWSFIVMMLIGGVLVGVCAAIWPAMRAAKTPPLDAISD